MGSSGKFKTEILKETVVDWDDLDVNDILVLAKESCKGVSIYRVYTGKELGGEFSYVAEEYATYDGEKAVKYFSRLEHEYPRKRIKRKIF